MKFKMVLTGGDSLIITEKQKQSISPYWGKDADIRLAVGNSEVRSKQIKAILEIKEESTVAYDKKQLEDHVEWNKHCELLSQLSVDEKVQKEMNTRILPGLLLSRSDYPETLLEGMESFLRGFFTQYSYYPRCPLRLWHPMVKQYVTSQNNKLSNWWFFVQRNDEVIERWVLFEKKKPKAR